MHKTIIMFLVLEITFSCAQNGNIKPTEEAFQQESLKMDDISIGDLDGPSTRLRQRRQKLEERNKIKVEKNIEDIQVKQEITVTNKLQDVFEKKFAPPPKI